MEWIHWLRARIIFDAVKYGEFLDQIRNCKLLKKYSVSGSLFICIII